MRNDPHFQAVDHLTGIVMTLAAGAAYAVFVPWITGYAMAVAWPDWWSEWAKGNTWLALRAWEALIVLCCWVVPGAVMAWLVMRVGRLPDWRYAWLAPLPVLAWTLLLPYLEGQKLFLVQRFANAPIAATLEAAALYLSIPLFAWVFRRRT